MLFVETPIFTRELRGLLSDDDYRALQSALLLRPEAGAIIPGSGGLRKVRWGFTGTGKRGGARVIYYWHRAEECIYMLLIYRKSRQEDLTPEQLRVLRKLVKENLK
ncbi:hypothetical protein EPO44_22230 [bacterium]|nr:MAG: hypothetical protein EPO44_22230 [bacterium]